MPHPYLIFLAMYSTIPTVSDCVVAHSGKIDPESYKKIDIGMSLQEVELILGGPWGSRCTGDVFFTTLGVSNPPSMYVGRVSKDDLRIIWPRIVNGRPYPYAETRGWIGHRHGIWITFSHDRQVVGKGIHDVTKLP